MEHSSWQPIYTIPIDTFVDVWVSSLDTPDFGIRIPNVAKSSTHSFGWVGIEKYYLTERIFPTHWMPIPKPPTYTINLTN